MDEDENGDTNMGEDTSMGPEAEPGMYFLFWHDDHHFYWTQYNYTITAYYLIAKVHQIRRGFVPPKPNTNTNAHKRQNEREDTRERT